MRFNIEEAKNKLIEKKTVTKEGAAAHPQEDRLELLKIVLTSFGEDRFYESSKSLYDRIQLLTKHLDNDFILKLAIFSREYGLRTINHFLVALYTIKNRGNSSTRGKLFNALFRMVRRPDELGEILGAYIFLTEQHPKKFIFPNALKAVYKQLIDSKKFDEYQISKYKGKGDISLYDIANLVRPKNDIIHKLMVGELKIADTWETNLSAGKDKKETFEKLAAENKLGGKAVLMNIKNMIESGIGDDFIAKSIRGIKTKGIFPFDVLRVWIGCATNGLRIGTEIRDALAELASKTFLENCKLEGKSCIITDMSGSMDSMISSKGIVKYIDLAIFYSALLSKTKGADIIPFASIARRIDSVPGDSVIRLIQLMGKEFGRLGLGTDINTAIELIQDKEYDNIIVFTDGQFSYGIKSTKGAKNFIVIRLDSYQNSCTIKGNVIELHGYTDLIWKTINDLGNLSNLALEIDKIELGGRSR